MTNARPRRATGQGSVDAQSIKKVTEICKDASPEDAQAALSEHNGDVQAAVMSLLDSAQRSTSQLTRDEICTILL
jgi:NACalpha-BTF3-like transcription factor